MQGGNIMNTPFDHNNNQPSAENDSFKANQNEDIKETEKNNL